MKYRLIELIGNYDGDNDGDFADYLLENGVIVPPLKVNDDIYAIKDGRVIKQFVVEVSKHHNGHMYFNYVPYGKNNTVEHFYLPSLCKESDIGKTVFLTKEEAEQALKGGE